ncbi:MAG: peptide deformylase [Syntrophales bacterium]|jgi:peptide deformylase|nr:peptide deformylase [Syntrophales bacterium]
MTVQRVLTLWDEGQIIEDDTRILRAPSLEAPLPFTAEVNEAIRALWDTFLDRDDSVGLAAPQIGINLRIIAVRTRNFDVKEREQRRLDSEILVNPRITQTRGELVALEEGCLSCPGVNIEVSRFPEIKVRAFDDEKGKKLNKRYLDFAARVVQHEIDHLDGKLIVDYEGPVYASKKYHNFLQTYFDNC